MVNLDTNNMPVAPALAITRRTLEALLGHADLPNWDDVTLIRKTTGRDGLSGDERRLLGDAAEKLPVFS